MNTAGYGNIPRELFHWITFLCKVLPIRSVGTFIELLIGSMLTPTGFVTDAYLMLDMRNHWTSYYKWLQNGRWSWLVLARQFVRLILRTVKGDSGGVIALPLLSRLIPSAGNTGKLVATNTLIRAVYRLFQGVKVRVLVDSWFMRRCFIESMEQRGFDVIGQVRRDTRLYEEPPKRKRGQRGRPRKYGEKYTPKRIAHFKRTEATLQLYGRSQDVHYRSKIAKARFLNGRLVMAVWCEFKSDNGRWKQTCLLISTDLSLTPEEIIKIYGERWSIDS